MIWRKFVTENGSLQCEFVFGEYHTFATKNVCSWSEQNQFCMGYAEINAFFVCSLKNWIEIIYLWEI